MTLIHIIFITFKNKTVKRSHLIISVFFFGMIFQTLKAQVSNPVLINDSGFQLSIRGGYDFPTFNNNTPYIDYKGGLALGASLDYYFKWFGIGVDFDYIKNRPKSAYPTNNLIYSGSPLTSFNLYEAGITRIFYGIGPDFKFQKNDRFSIELKLRGGLASIKGGRTYLQGTPVSSPPVDLNFHAGYDQKNVLSAKGQLQVNYFLNDYLGFHVGAYYLEHFQVPELVDPLFGFSASYQPFVTNNNNNIINSPNLNVRSKPCNCEIHSIGVFAGITFRLPIHKNKEPEDPKPGKCTTCDKYSLTVTARDKFTKELLAKTDVVVKNTSGEVIQTGTTNSFGVVIFLDIIPDNYTIDGLLYGIKLDGATALKNEFMPKETLQKEVLYSDPNFIIKGKAVICNSTTPLKNVSVTLKNLTLAEQRNTITDANGEFVFNVKQQTTYQIYGKKEKYFSQTEDISTSDFDRNTALFVKLEICMEDADCDKAIVLKNIHYDLDKYFLREESKKELNRLVQFMTDNPGVRVELRSHTDSRGSNSYNETLSQNRANAAVDYVVSQGIRRDRLVGKGYGETQLLNECADGVNCPEEKHQQNRRTEVKVICPGK